MLRSILVAIAGAHGDLLPHEIHILDPETRGA